MGTLRRWLAPVLLFALVLSVSAPVGAAPPGQGGEQIGPNPFGNFEVEGNLADDPPPADDWASVDAQVFDDVVGKGDDIFRKGSKQNEPGGWACETGSVPDKNDLEESGVFFREVGGEQYLYLYWLRDGTNGSAHVDFELNQSTTPNPSCPELPQRTDGDLLLTYDAEQGGKDITIRVFEWAFTGPGVGEFTELTGGLDFSAATNGDGDIPARDAGAFGEAVVNLTTSEAIGEITCDEFGAVHVKTRASFAINAELKDRTEARPFEGPCPVSELHKSVRNASDGETFSDTDPESPSSTTASPGDEIAYRLTYHNHGAADATGVTVTEEIPERSTFQSCSDSCTQITDDDTDPDVDRVVWELGTVVADGSDAVTFQVILDDAFPEGDTTIANVATASSDTDSDDSNPATVTVTAAPDLSVDKSIQEAGPYQVGDTVTYQITVTNDGDADATVTITDSYDPDHVDVQQVDDGGTDDGMGTITWTDVTVAANGGTATVTYTARFVGEFTSEDPHGACDGTNDEFPVQNTATADGASDTHEPCVEYPPDFAFTKTADDTTVTFGDTVTWTIRVDNDGAGPGNVTFTDTYDRDDVDVDFGSIDKQACDLDENAGTLTCTTDVLDPGGSQTFTYAGTIRDTASGEAGTEGCAPDRFPTVNTVTVSGDEVAGEVVCIIGQPLFDVEKTADQSTVKIGDTVTYTITVTNIGDGPGSTQVSDDYDADHLDIPLDDSEGGTTNSIDPDPDSHDRTDGTITWTTGTLSANGGQETFTYTGTVVGDFPSGSQTDPDCPDDHFPVINSVTVEGDDATGTICVEAEPDLQVSKSTTADDVTAGDEITYTIEFRNDGDAAAENVVVEDSFPDTEFVSCSDSCQQVDADTVRWSLGTVEPGETGSLTLTVRVTESVGCVVCDTATITGTSVFGTVFSDSFQLCIDAVPVPRPDLANAHDSAFGAHVRADLAGLSLIDEAFVPVTSSQSGVGSDSDSAELLDLDVPADGSVLRADVLRTSSTSTITAEPPEARHTSVAETTGVDVLEGVVTADLVRGVASTTATGSSSAFSSTGSTFVNLEVDLDGSAGPMQPTAMEDVTPNTRIDLPADLFGTGSYIVLYERDGSTTTPADGQLSGGTYGADLAVNMIRVHVTAMGLFGDQVDVTVSNAVAHSDFPQTTLCEQPAAQAVSGHAFILRALTDPSIAPVLVGYTDIPANGGADHQNLNETAVPADGSVASTGEAVSDTRGELTTDASDASAYAEAADVCLLPDATGACLIGADVVRSESNSHADAGGASSNDGDGDGDGDTVLVGLEIAGTPIAVTPEPNTVVEVPGVGFVVLNEQFCTDEQNPPSTSGPVDCGGATSTAQTVRALRLVVTRGDVLPLGAEVIVAEAHSDATFAAP